MAKKTQGKAPKKEKGTGAGRPSDYRPEFAPQVRKLFLLKSDATDTDIAEFFGKSESTINKWKVDYPEFSEAIRAGKTPADTEVADSLFRRANGAEWTEEVAFKVKVIEYEGGKKSREYEDVKVVTIRKQAPPDTQACTVWLTNRRRDTWAPKPEALPPSDAPIGDEYALKPDEAVPNAPIL
ncbi:hypothetical protein [Micavibrio aeruginosavorus]|uniref:Terminase n=1 Tax=Micavibrio aeruginosavorus (strain ARL-13) TaxID=856793 RepID=G2KMW9_MICAA|nr:hypothetical protein [Micavibrio aeruginosavorus]AEP08901.1 putative uncharacterized protein [Micavibrio aeruginosavorus ARL-13]